MVNIRDVYHSGGDYLKAADIPRGPGWLVTVAGDEVREFEQTNDRGEVRKVNKTILSFKEMEQKLVCAKTVADEIALYYGEETTAWHGRKIIIFVMENVKNPQGSGPALRVRIPPEEQLRAQQAAPPAAPPAPPRDHMQAYQQQPQPARPSYVVPSHQAPPTAPAAPPPHGGLHPSRIAGIDDEVPF